MITGKQRAYLRKMAHQLEPIFQIGKEGVTDAFIDGLNKALTKREIVKVHILETAMLDTRDTCNYVAERLGAEPVQAIGNKFIIYRKSDEEKYRKSSCRENENRNNGRYVQSYP